MDTKNPSLPWVQAVSNNRLLVIVIVFLCLVAVGLGGTIVALFPLKKTELIYVEFQHSTNSFMVVQRAEKSIRSNEALIAMFLRSYVSCRETVDKMTEPDRYAHVLAFSSPKVRDVFRAIYGDKDRGLYYQTGKKRAVHIINDSALGGGVHQVLIETTDTTDGVDRNKDGRVDEKKTEWMITLRYGFYDQEVTKDPRNAGGPHLLNPMGMMIEEYAIKKLEKGSGK